MESFETVSCWEAILHYISTCLVTTVFPDIFLSLFATVVSRLFAKVEVAFPSEAKVRFIS